MSDPVEHTERFCTTVADLSGAWAFIMEYVDRVGPDPTIQIKPVWRMPFGWLPQIDQDQPPMERFFEVVVDGMREM